MSSRTEMIMESLLAALDNPQDETEEWVHTIENDEQNATPMFGGKVYIRNGNSSFQTTFNIRG